MTDVRNILAEGADVSPGLPDVPQLVRRGRIARRRQVAAVTMASTVAAVLAVVVGLDVAAMLTRTSEVPTVTPRDLEPLPALPGQLQSGAAYDAGSAGFDLTFQVPGDGWVMAVQQEGWLSLHQGETRVNLQRWSGVVDPAEQAPDPAVVQPLPTDLGAWLRAHARLDVTTAAPVRLAGDEWAAYDASVARPLRPSPSLPSECRALPCVLLAATGDEGVEVLARERLRILLAPDSAGAGALVLLIAYPASQSRPDPEVEALVDSFEER